MTFTQTNVNRWAAVIDLDTNTDSEVLKLFLEDENVAIAKMHRKYAGMLNSLCRSYNCFDYSDKQSLIFECIYKAMQSYNKEAGANFATYLTRVTTNKFRSASNYVFAKSKNRQWFLEAVYVDGNDNESENVKSAIDNMAAKQDVFGMIDILESVQMFSLSTNQYNYLKLILDCPYETLTDAEAARCLGVTKSGVSVIRKGIAKKLQDKYAI